MIAVDTNVLVRYLTNDDQAQAQRAYALLARATRVFVAKTAEWCCGGYTACRRPPC